MTKSADAADRKHMERALLLAERGLYDTDPNPTVGCVLVNGGEIVGEGWTAPAGGPHAERVALAAAGARARGATAYVTLEPCNHTGRTGPCTEALIEAGVKRVICAMLDPNPLVSGSGVKRLEAAGIPVTVGVLHASAEPLNRGYLSRMTRERPWVRVKIAATLDGRTALANGASRWITGPAARQDVHAWRARSSAVLTGVGTILVDDPSLSARLDGEGINVLQPARVILDSRLRTPPSAKTLELPGDVLIFGGRDEGEEYRLLTAAGARVERVPASPHCDLHAVLARLAELEYNDVFVEAGPRVSGALLQAALIDELVIYLAPHVLGDGARGMFDVGVLTELEQRYRLKIEDVTRLGPDLRIMARPSTVAGA
jgi:diaminohydroxyphosphoribosylaminopyrimidine deaminase/5-amino-6-(5-phosphoribosylamino)uracil reductase